MKRGVQQASVKKQLPRLGPKVSWLSIHKQELQQENNTNIVLSSREQHHE